MGILDMLKNVDTGKINESLSTLAGELKKVTDAVSEAIPDDVKQQIKEAAEKDKAEQEQKAAAVETAQAKTDVSYATASYEGFDRADYDVELPEDEMDCAGKIKEVLAADFADYEVFEDVSPTMIGGTGKFMNYSIGVYKDGAPKLFIMIIGQKTNRLRLYRWSKEQAEKAGVPMINFVGHYPNRYWYIKERLAQYL